MKRVCQAGENVVERQTFERTIIGVEQYLSFRLAGYSGGVW